MPWQLTHADGLLAGRPLATVMACGGVLNDAPLAASIDAGQANDPASLADKLAPFWRDDVHNWLILPEAQRVHRDWWQSLAGNGPDPGFGRAQVALALKQMTSLQLPARLLAVDRVPLNEGWTDNVLALDWQPAKQGLEFIWSRVDGRLDGKTDVGAMLEQACSAAPNPEVVLCPGNVSDGAIERLLPFMGSLAAWAAPAVRWEFAEARVGPMGVVGGLYSWLWLHEGYRMGDWQQTAAVIDMDQSPLVGLSLVNFRP